MQQTVNKYRQQRVLARRQSNEEASDSSLVGTQNGATMLEEIGSFFSS